MSAKHRVKITIQNALKKFGDNTIIADLNLEIHPGEFFTLLGPSGCGKTTLLRMIAGFNSIEGGDFLFNDKRINDLDPAKRNIGMVFQNYAIFPHLSVRSNVEYGLKNKKMNRADIRTQADKFLQLMQIANFADRMPDRLSGGQQQRVALARALCIEPDVLLMDEPLSNLDAKLRVEMRSIIKQIQHEVGITTVYVTHDQEEAMAVSDRIAVMNGGEIQQVASPKAIYQRPSNLFVSTFIGRSNVIEAKLTMENGKAMLRKSDYCAEAFALQDSEKKDQTVYASIRPEEVLLSKEPTGLTATVKDCVFLGLNTHYFLKLDSGEDMESVQESSFEETIPVGAQVHIAFNMNKVNLFSHETQRNMMTGVEDDNRR